MMRKIWGAAITLLVPFTVLAQANQGRDTLALSPLLNGLTVPMVPYQYMVYKNRLDSIQKTVPLTYNEYVQKYIDIYTSRKGQIGKVLGLSTYYFPIFEKSLKEFDIPDEIKYVSIVESSLDPHAVSKTGATGPWQFMSQTAKGYGLKMDRFVDERKDPVSASHAAAAYFRDAYNELGDWLLAIAAYNCGKGAVTRAIAKSGGKADFWSIRNFLPQETRNYVPAFIATTYIMNCYNKHDITSQQSEFSLLNDVIEVNSPVSLEAIAKAANVDIKLLSLLNPSYKKLFVNGSSGSPKRIVIPENKNQETYASLYETLNNSTSALPEMIAAPRNTSAPTAVRQPAKKYISYKVKAGDTLSEIASKFTGSNVSEIKSKNRLKSSVLQPGMILKINKG
ncbi:lytic transglycosylase domain-containing protein [Hufsiella ginkgonis]|uniref:Transglycosylase SLT domain-containing protein n=1 Tax=Hufsiella ginkgonis TaxID=2695274 RepID=A0A7K1Y4B1_9SPHI|nr:lytic transglycosylase domain-containing protein [Hufsiella ginkgonis]MXV17948.1 transglycosylase SLT domain-containing protein [Hufsiella ginkgonis]